MKLKLLMFGFIACLLIVVGCDDDPDPEPEVITYTNTIKSIIDANCATSGCHNEGAMSPSFEMHDYATLVTAVGFGNILDAINHDTTNNVIPMPYPPGSAKIDQSDIDDITTWINNGTPE